MRKGATILLCCGLITALATITAVTFQGQGEKSSKAIRKNIEMIDESQWPLTDFNAPEPSDPSERDKRRAKSDKHNKSLLGLKGAVKSPPPAGRVILVTDWEVGLPALPIEQSSVVITGEVIDGRSYVSGDQSGVYSEFTIRVSEVLKNDERASLATNSLIAADRQGGRVRVQTDKVALFTIRGQRMPLVGHKYIFFLAGRGHDSNYHIVTGYEVREERVFPLDDVKRHPIETLTGKDVQAVLEEIRASSANRVP